MIKIGWRLHDAAHGNPLIEFGGRVKLITQFRAAIMLALGCAVPVIKSTKPQSLIIDKADSDNHDF